MFVKAFPYLLVKDLVKYRPVCRLTLSNIENIIFSIIPAFILPVGRQQGFYLNKRPAYDPRTQNLSGYAVNLPSAKLLP